MECGSIRVVVLPALHHSEPISVVRENYLADFGQGFDAFFGENHGNHDPSQFQDPFRNRREVFAEFSHGDSSLANKAPKPVNIAGFLVKFGMHGFESPQQPPLVVLRDKATAPNQLAQLTHQFMHPLELRFGKFIYRDPRKQGDVLLRLGFKIAAGITAGEFGSYQIPQTAKIRRNIGDVLVPLRSDFGKRFELCVARDGKRTQNAQRFDVVAMMFWQLPGMAVKALKLTALSRESLDVIRGQALQQLRRIKCRLHLLTSLSHDEGKDSTTHNQRLARLFQSPALRDCFRLPPVFLAMASWFPCAQATTA
jgi:hypothetical protein